MDNRSRLFISYARDDDEPFVKRLYGDLIAHGFDVWWDRETMESRGRTFLQEIREAIASVDRLILVIGPRAVQSRYVHDEWQFALESCKVVVPILRLGDYDLLPKDLPKLHCPDVRSGRPYEAALAELIRILSAPVAPLGAAYGVEALPENFLPRPEYMQELSQTVLADISQPTVITSAGRTAALKGMGGIGKSVLAAALGRACETRRACYNGIFWIKVGQHPADLTGQMRIVGLELGDDQLQFYADQQSSQVRLTQLLADKKCLLIVDDVWDIRSIEPFVNALGPLCRLLITTRDGGLVTALGAQEIKLDVLSDDQALALLAKWAGADVQLLPAEAQEVARECGNLPLGLAMIGAMVHGRPDRWENALHKLRQADLEQIARQFPNYEYPNLLRAIQISVEALADPEIQKRYPDVQARYLDLAVFPEDTPIPEAVLSVFWARAGLDKFQVQDMLDFLVDRSLVQRDESDRLTLHDLQLDYVRKQVTDLRSRHQTFLDAYAARCLNGWSSGPADGYFFEHLAYHLMQAGREAELRDLLLDFEWLQTKLKTTDVTALLRDFDYLPGNPELRLVHEAIKRSAQILQQDRAQLVGQVLGRILSYPEPAIYPLLEQARQWRGTTWIRPLTSTLTPPGDPLLFTLSGHEGTVRSIAITPDGRWGVTAGNSHPDRTVRLWDFGQGIELHTLPDQAEAGGFTPLGLTPDGQRLLCARGSDIEVWKVATGEHMVTLGGHAGLLTALAVALEGLRAISAADDGTLIVWDLMSWRKKAELPPQQEPVYAVAITPNGRFAVSASSAALRLWDLEHQQEVAALPGETGFAVGWPPLALLLDGRRVFFGDPLTVWDVDTNVSRPVFETARQGRVLSITLDGRIALSSPDTQVIEVWDLEQMTRVVTLPAQGSAIATVAITPDGRTAIAALFDHYLKVWALENRVTSVVSPRRGNFVEMTIDGQRAVSIENSEIVEVWSLKDGLPISDPVARDPVEHELQAIWKARDELYRTAANMFEQRQLHNHLASGSYQVEWEIAAVDSGRVILRIKQRGKTSEEEEADAAVGGYALQVWNLEAPDAKPIFLYGHSSPVTAVVITPDGRQAVSGCIGRTLRVWDLEAGKQLRTLRGHHGRIWDVKITPDDKYAVSVSEDRTVKVWNLSTGQSVATFTGELAMRSCAIGRDGRTIVALDSLGRVHFLQLEGE